MPGTTENTIVIGAPLQLVWDVTNDVAGWPRLFTEYAAAEIVERNGDTVVFRLTMHPDDQGHVWSWVSERTPDAATRTVIARRVEKGPFDFMDIRWTYAPEGSGTRMTWKQDFAMAPTAPVDDGQMTERINRNTKIQMSVIRDKIEAMARSTAVDVTGDVA